MTRALMAILLVAGCGKSSLLTPSGTDTNLGGGDLSPAVGVFDLGPSSPDQAPMRADGGPIKPPPPPPFDLSPPPVDLKPTGPTCQQVLTCLLQCGSPSFQCVFQCQQGASPEERQKFQALASCGLRHCASLAGGDGGISIQSATQCLSNHCSTELFACIGNGFGGGGN